MAVQNGFCYNCNPASHRAGGVVRATGVGIQGILIMGIQEIKDYIRKINGTYPPKNQMI